MRYNIYCWDGTPPLVYGVYEEYGSYFIDISDEEFGDKIKELAYKYDVMIKIRDNVLIILLDNKGYSFRQR